VPENLGQLAAKEAPIVMSPHSDEALKIIALHSGRRPCRQPDDVDKVGGDQYLDPEMVLTITILASRWHDQHVQCPSAGVMGANLKQANQTRHRP
jgi:hypothetical protein